MKRDWLLYLVIFSLALNVGTIGAVVYLRHQDHQTLVAGHLPPPPPMPLRTLWRELNLDDSQRQTLQDLFPEHRRKVGELRHELAHRRVELFNLIRDDATAWSVVQAKIQEISALQGSLELEMTRFMLAFKKNLNPAQHAVFLNLVQMRLCSPGGPCDPIGPGKGRRGGPGMGPPD